MDPSIDLEQTISDAVNDATFDTAPEPDVVSSDEPPADAGLETSPEPLESSTEPAESMQVSSPASTPSDAPKDDFERLTGIPQMGVAGRENRIPYSRVKKITERAVNEKVNELAETTLGRKLNQGENPVDLLKAHVSQIPTLQAQTKDYEARLNTVGEFERVMANEPQRFLEMVSSIPAYKDFFQFVEQAYSAFEQGQWGPKAAAGASPTQQPTNHGGSQTGTPTPISPLQGQPAAEGDPMPEPDETLSDGSRQYSMEGVRKLLEWNSRQVASKITNDLTKQFDNRFKPIEQDWQAQKRIEATLPVIRMQIAEARTWPLFNESEADIVKVLDQDKNISLEAAYRKVVFPKILADRTKIRQEVISDIRKAPVGNSSVAAKIQTKPTSPISSGPRSLEDVIKEQVDNLRS